MTKAIITLLALLAVCNAANPVVLIHGIGDSCENSGMQGVASMFGYYLGVDAECIESGAGFDSFLFTTMKSQEEAACAALKANPKFAGKDIDIVGLSQGSLIARGLIQNCDFGGSFKKFISIAGPHMGVYTVPNCADGTFCDILNSVVRFAVYNGLAQNLVGAANYFKDSRSYKSYLASARYLPDLNNERSTKNATHKQRFSSLEGVMLVMFTNDTVINPKETAWFGYYDENLNLKDMTETPLYQEDYIGLKTLDVTGRLKRIKLPGQHLQFSNADILEVFVPFLATGRMTEESEVLNH